MSSYINFYIKKGDNYTPLLFQGRNSQVYSCLEDRYGYFEELKQDKIDKIIFDLKQKIIEFKLKIKKEEEKFAEFSKTHCEYTEWNSAYFEKETAIEDLNACMDEIESAISIFNVLSLILYNCSICGKDGYMTLWYGIDIAEDDNGNPIVNKH